MMVAADVSNLPKYTCLSELLEHLAEIGRARRCESAYVCIGKLRAIGEHAVGAGYMHPALDIKGRDFAGMAGPRGCVGAPILQRTLRVGGGCFHARAGWAAFRLRLCSTRKSRFASKVQPLRLEIPRRCCRAGCWVGRLVRHWRFAKWQLLEGLTWPLGLRLKRRARFLETCCRKLTC